MEISDPKDAVTLQLSEIAKHIQTLEDAAWLFGASGMVD